MLSLQAVIICKIGGTQSFFYLAFVRDKEYFVSEMRNDKEN